MTITEIKTLRNKRMLYFHKLWGVFFVVNRLTGRYRAILDCCWYLNYF
jgi:hypothetical protein